MIDQENVKEFKVTKRQKISMLFIVILFLFMGSLCFFDKSLTGSEMILIFIFTQSATIIAAFIAYSNFKMMVYFFEDKLIYKEAFKKRKEIKYSDVTNIKLFTLHGFKIQHNKRYNFIPDYIENSYKFLKLLYEKINKYNPEIIDDKLKRKFDKRFRYLLRRHFYNFWVKKNYLLILFISILFGVIIAFSWDIFFYESILLDFSLFFMISFYWFLLSYFVYSLKFRKYSNTIMIEDSIDGLFNDFYKRHSYKKYFIIFTLMLIAFCVFNFFYL